MNAIQRGNKLQWLRDGGDDNECRILSNAKCLSEGVDVPALDAVIFLNPRKSQVDVVQSVGRVMRKAEGKQYGYVILPLIFPSDTTPEEALNRDPDAYKVIWQVLQALRAHDERFSAMINRLELNKKPPPEISIIKIGGDTPGAEEDSGDYAPAVSLPLPLPPGEWRNEILARIIKKCGDRLYWEVWAKDVAKIAQANAARIRALLKKPEPRQHFDRFLAKLRKNLNPGVSEENAIEMLSQHLITRPVFDALFQDYAFAKQNPVSLGMQRIIKTLDNHGLESEIQKLDKFYDSVRRRAAGIDNAEGKQTIMKELYEKFFSTAFKKQSEKLGIIYTPVEIVDFILESADKALHQEFNRRLTDKEVHILDPFTGTGTFMARLLRKENPLIKNKDLPRKYQNELHANEITLLAYYIAAVNIEEIYHHRSREAYQPFGGIILTDTFQLSENTGDISEEFFQENSARAKKQRNKPIKVIIGNPPYSVGQRSANDDNQNQKYENLDKRIKDTYAKDSPTTNIRSLYDSYIRSIRWASDRIKDEGIVAFVTNGSFIDGNATVGLRKHLLKDFSAVYCLNLRGNARTQGEQRRKERGNVFGGGSRTPVAITLLIKKKNGGPGKLYYHDIGDYLNREEKLEEIKQYQSYKNVPWNEIQPNKEADWINQRHPEFAKYLPMGDLQNRRSHRVDSIFSLYSVGLKTNRDAWVYGYSKETLSKRIKKMIAFYNSQINGYDPQKHKDIKKYIGYDPRKFSWDRELERDMSKHRKGIYEKQKIQHAIYRPYVKQWLYFDRQFNNMIYRIPSIFPTPDTKNLAITVSGVGAGKEFSALMVNTLPDLELVSKGQCFPLYRYDEKNDENPLKVGGNRQDNIPEQTLHLFQNKYADKKISKEDIFHYVYGILHSPQYKTKYAADLTKMLPRIPQVKSKKDFVRFTQAGRALAALHLHYETAPEHPLKEEYSDLIIEHRSHTVTKMRFAGEHRNPDKTAIIYNSDITLTGIPEKAYRYQVNGKSAIEWIMERYQKTTHTESGITNDPNDWSDDPLYILSLLKRIIHISIESVKIIESLPPLDI